MKSIALCAGNTPGIDSDGRGLIKIGNDTPGQFQGAGGGYAFKLASGEYAGLAIREDKTSSSGYTAYITRGKDQDNVITLKNFDLNAAQNTSGNGYLGIKLDPTQKLALIAGDGKTLGGAASNFWADINSEASALAGKSSSFAERNGRAFTISLAVVATAGSKIILSMAGVVPVTTKFIALRAGVASPNCLKRLKNRAARKQARLHAKSGSRPIHTCAKRYEKDSLTERTKRRLRHRVRVEGLA
jgi:hypothetical protein